MERKQPAEETRPSAYFCNAQCEYYPCHQNAKGDFFNCLFCYCPLYALGENCGGNFRYTQGGVKDCSLCLIPHSRGGYDYIMGRFGDVAKLAKKKS